MCVFCIYIYICIYRLCYTFIYINIYKYSDTKISFYFIYRGVPDWEVVVLWPGCKNHHIEEDPQSPQLDAESSDSDANHQSSCQNTETAGSADWWFHSPKTTPMKCLREIASMYLSFIEPGMSMSQTGSPMRSPDEVSAVGPAVSWSVVSHRCWWVKLDPRWGPDEVQALFWSLPQAQNVCRNHRDMIYSGIWIRDPI